MTIRQALKTGEQLRQALQVLFVNYVSAQERDAVQVKFISTIQGRRRSFIFTIQISDAYWWDTHDLTREIERVFPNVKVTEVQVAFFSKSIWCTVKELGRNGSYRFVFSMKPVDK
jgi:hypothetical protein